MCPFIPRFSALDLRDTANLSLTSALGIRLSEPRTTLMEDSDRAALSYLQQFTGGGSLLAVILPVDF